MDEKNGVNSQAKYHIRVIDSIVIGNNQLAEIFNDLEARYNSSNVLEVYSGEKKIGEILNDYLVFTSSLKIGENEYEKLKVEVEKELDEKDYELEQGQEEVQKQNIQNNQQNIEPNKDMNDNLPHNDNIINEDERLPKETPITKQTVRDSGFECDDVIQITDIELLEKLGISDEYGKNGLAVVQYQNKYQIFARESGTNRLVPFEARVVKNSTAEQFLKYDEDGKVIEDDSNSVFIIKGQNGKDVTLNIVTDQGNIRVYEQPEDSKVSKEIETPLDDGNPNLKILTTAEIKERLDKESEQVRREVINKLPNEITMPALEDLIEFEKENTVEGHEHTHGTPWGFRKH